jgi:DNA-binding NarL/FixJ family response regulator
MDKSLLIVDDSAPIRRCLRAFVESRSGFTVCGEAVDGVDAVEKARVLRPDLIVLDFSMPRMNGIEAAALLQSFLPSAPIILFTLHKEEVSTRMAHDAGVSSILSKTEQLGVLYKEMQRLAHSPA